MRKHWTNGANIGIPSDKDKERLAEDRWVDARGEEGNWMKSEAEEFARDVGEQSSLLLEWWLCWK